MQPATDRVQDARRSTRARRTAAAAAIVACAGLAAYSNSFTDLFVGLDGKESIRDNPHIRSVWPLSEALSIPMWEPPLDMAQHPAVAHRPTFSASLALTNRFVGSEPRAHHAVNLAIHIAAALALFGIVRRTLGLQLAEPTWLALAAALIWLVHPLQTESVTYIVQRSESLMGLFLFLTVYCAIRAVGSRHRLWWQAGAIGACVLGAGCKQTAAVAPLLIFLHDYTFAARSQAKWSRPVFYLLLAAAALIEPMTYAGKIATYVEGVRPLPYARAQPAVVLHYLKLALWPDDLFLYVNTRVFDVQSLDRALAPAAALTLLLAATIHQLARRHWLGFVGAWFFVTLGCTSSFIPISDVIQEHRMYVPLAALAVLAAVGGEWAVRTWTPRLTQRQRGAIDVILLAAVVLALGIRTYVRNWDYHREFTMIHPADVHEDYTILADHYLSNDDLIRAEAVNAHALLALPDPDARDVTFAHFVLGLAHARGGRLQPAVAEFRRVADLDPEFAYAHHHLGIALRDTGDLAAAIKRFRRAIRIEPNLVYARKELALALAMAGNTAAAEEQLQMALRIQPRFGEGLFELGILALRRGDKQEAKRLFTEALRVRPDLAEPHYELGMLCKEAGDAEDARAHLTAAAELRPDFAEAHGELALLLESTGDRGAAIAQLQRVVRSSRDFSRGGLELARMLRERDELDDARRFLRRATKARPRWLEARHELARVLVRAGRLQRATVQMRRTIEQLEPRVLARPRATRAREELGTLHSELGTTLAERGDVDGAVEHLTEAIRLRPDFAQAHTELGNALRARGDVDRAIEQFEEAIRLHPESADAYKAFGIVLRDRGDLEGAAERFEKAVSLEPDYADAHNELGWLRKQQGDLEAAAKHFERALAIQPDFAAARTGLEEVEARLPLPHEGAAQ